MYRKFNSQMRERAVLTGTIIGCVAAIAAIVAFVYVLTNEKEMVNIPVEMKALYKRPVGSQFPEGNPYSDAKANLGKVLFFETRISRSGMVACASCHNPALGWTNGQRRGVGDYHKPMARKDPTILNLAWDELFFWDGSAESLEKQAVIPIQAAGEMNMSLENLIERLKEITEYKPLFIAAFPDEADPITVDNVAKAIATFERTVISGKAPFDKWIEGDVGAISDDAKRGFLLFNTKANCSSCHSGWRFSDGSFHDIGINDNDIGRGKLIPNVIHMQHAFKTMGLRDISRRNAYMHNGSMTTLKEVIDHYDNGFVMRESLSHEIKPLHLTDQEKKDLEIFMDTLTGENEPITIPELPK